jgi:hypothetical protein
VHLGSAMSSSSSSSSSSSARYTEPLADAQKAICREIWCKAFEPRVAFGVKFFKPEHVYGICAKVRSKQIATGEAWRNACNIRG